MRISDWSSDVCSSDLTLLDQVEGLADHRVEQVRVVDAQQHVLLARLRHHGLAVRRRVGHRLLDQDVAAVLHRRKRDRGVGGRGRQHMDGVRRSEEHTSELQSLMRISYAVFCLKKKNKQKNTHITQAT